MPAVGITDAVGARVGLEELPMTIESEDLLPLLLEEDDEDEDEDEEDDDDEEDESEPSPSPSPSQGYIYQP